MFDVFEYQRNTTATTVASKCRHPNKTFLGVVIRYPFTLGAGVGGSSRGGGGGGGGARWWLAGLNPLRWQNFSR